MVAKTLGVVRIHWVDPGHHPLVMSHEQSDPQAKAWRVLQGKAVSGWCHEGSRSGQTNGVTCPPPNVKTRPLSCSLSIRLSKAESDQQAGVLWSWVVLVCGGLYPMPIRKSQKEHERESCLFMLKLDKEIRKKGGREGQRRTGRKERRVSLSVHLQGNAMVYVA